jgi:ABC-type branched-subunit amino acid transport system ATPase component
MLRLERVDAFIEGVHVLRGVTLEVPAGGTVALIGRNGAGKTTCLRAVMGFVPVARGGRVLLDDTDLNRHAPHERPALGIGYAPEDRRLFASFTVEENILLPAQVCRLPEATVRERLERIYEVLPEVAGLRARRAGSLSGGQGKMVALGRALMVGSRVVLLDEPFQGLAPALALRYAETLRRLRDREREVALLVTESNPSLLLPLAETTYRIERGEVERVDAAAAPRPAAAVP